MDSMALDILQAPDSNTNHCYYEPHNPDWLRTPRSGLGSNHESFCLYWDSPNREILIIKCSYWLIDDQSQQAECWLLLLKSAQLSGPKFELTTGLCPLLSSLYCGCITGHSPASWAPLLSRTSGLAWWTWQHQRRGECQSLSCCIVTRGTICQISASSDDVSG